jgi:hypothetical protein
MAHEMQTPTGAGPGYGPSGAGYGPSYDARERPGHGWLTFAAVMLFAAGAVNALWGISALSKASYFHTDSLLFGELKMWGVLALVFGGLQLLAGGLIVGRRTFGIVLGIGLALLSGMFALITIGGYPVWSVVVLVIDGLIIYGLTVYGFGEA